MLRTLSRCLFILLVTGCARDVADPPSTVVSQFFSARITSGLTGAPSDSQLAQLAPFLADTLEHLLVAARRLRDAEAASAPDEKPSFVEGDLFSSLFEGPTSFTIVPDTGSAPPGRVLVRLQYAGGGDTVSWTDRVVISQQNGHNVIADIEYGGNWAFGNSGTLRMMLERALAPRTTP